MRNIKCRLFGHKTGELNDSGYPICEKCGNHSYYDDWEKSALLLRPIWVVQRKLYQFKYWFRDTFLNDIPF